MELFYLLAAIISTTLTSTVLSIILFLRLLLRRLIGSRAAIINDSVTLYQGTVWHERRRPVHHSFKYSVRYALIDLDCSVDAPPDHLSAGEARRVAETDGPVFLLTIPPSVGYVQNPLSVYYCYELEGSTSCLKKCIAEVANTPWGERVLFLFNPSSDLVAKPLHVSPFMDMHGNWSIKASTPGDNLMLTISVQHPKLGDYFTASLTAKKVSSSTIDQALFFWLMPHKVAFWIYWRALKLWWKGVSFIQHPRYNNPSYKEEAILNDKKLFCCPAFSPNLEMRQDRWFQWRDAMWPWC